MKRYKFLMTGFKSENGNMKWEIDKWYHEDKISICNKGFHCSNTILDALSYVRGEIVCEVDTKGKSIKQGNKSIWSDMKVVKAWEWTKNDSVALAIFSAELCIENFEEQYPEDDRPRKAIEAAKAWLKNPMEENEMAARSAARSAAYSAAYSALSAAYSAHFAAYSAARSDAYSAASSAVDSAASSALSAARSASSASFKETEKKINTWLIKHLEDMKKI